MSAISKFITAVTFLFVFLRLLCFMLWAIQVIDLMRRINDEFPGRYDKLVWGSIIVFGSLLGAIVNCFAKPQ